MAAKRSRDITFSTDDQACRTLILDLGEDAAKQPAPDEEATVVLDLTPAQVHEVLTNPDATFRNVVKKK